MSPDAAVKHSAHPPSTVLLVDDREGNLVALGAVLEPLNARLVRAASGRDALKFLLEQTAGDDCALILLDVQMPGMSGFETAELIRQRARTQKTPIMFVTASARDEVDIRRGYATGACDYVVKPFDPDILLAKIRVILDQHDLTQAARRDAAEQLAAATRLREEAARRDRERLELERARERHQRHDYVELLAEAIPQLAWIADPDGSISWFNQRWYDFTGAGAAQMTGWGWTGWLHPEARAQVTAHYREGLAGAQQWESTFQLRGKDGSYRWFLARAMSLRDDSGLVTRWFGTNTDVTEQRESELALRAVSQRKTEFIGILSHELRNPLGPIRNSLAVLVHDGKSPERTSEAVSVIARQVDHLGRLVDDLLDVTRITTGRIALRRSSVDLAAVASTAAADYRFLFQGRGIGLALEVPEQPVWVDADPLRATQVIGNLLHNAARFTPAGGKVALAVTDTPHPALSIQDTGIGLEADLLERIFEPFTQSPRSKAYTQGGLGIGLSIVKGLVELQGGSVRAHSEGVDRGLQIVVTLPRGGEPAAAAPRRAPPLRPSPRSILLIEDNRDAAEVLAALLELDGHTVRVAFDGEEGVRLALAEPPEVVICDLGLPLLDGFGVARALRQRPELSSTLLVALSGFAQAHDKEQAAAAGFDLHLAKPADLDELQAIIAAAPARRLVG